MPLIRIKINKNKLNIIISSAVIIFILIRANIVQCSESYILATATSGGTYYPVGVAIATLTKIKLAPNGGPSLSAISSAGSAENIKLMRNKEVQFAMLQGIYGYWAKTGTGPLEKQGQQKYLRTITALWPNVEHWLVRDEFVETSNASDFDILKGRKISIGARNSGTEGSGRTILERLGYVPNKDFRLVFQGYEQSVDGLQDGRIDAANLPAGPPVSAVTRALAAKSSKIRILSFSDAQMNKINSNGQKLWIRYNIPTGTYPRQNKPIASLAQANFLATHKNISEDDVYNIVSTIYNNIPFLRTVHAATANINLENAIKGLLIPLHPGAVRFYKEKGLDIPENLIP